MTPRVAIFFYYQNVYHSASSAFRTDDMLSRRCYVDPALPAERIIAKRRSGGELTDIRVYRAGRTRPPTRGRSRERPAGQRVGVLGDGVVLD
jgi:hypothetical protein